MKQIIITAFAALTGMVAQAQVKETRAAKPVTAIEVTDGVTVVLTQGETPQLEAEAANRETLNNVVTEYKKGVLKVYLKPAEETTMQWAEGVTVYVSTPLLNSFTATKGAIINVKGSFNASSLDVNLNSGAVCNASINATGTCHITARGGSGYRGVITAANLEADALGGAYIKASGQADTVSVVCKGGSVHIAKVLCQQAEVLARNAAAVSVNVSDYVKADADATSSISYYGEPAKVVTGENSYKIVRETAVLTLN